MTAISAPTIRYEDDQLAVISKPAGLIVHPGSGHSGPTLLDWLTEQWPELTDNPRAGLLHRLDKGTSGLLLIAKTSGARAGLAEQFAARTITKQYQALVDGVPAEPAGAIDAPISRHQTERVKMAIRPDGKSAQTRYQVIKTFDGQALLEVEIATGRTHQIRVHLAALGHPVVGDATYGQADPKLDRLFLHAATLSFQHPATGKTITVTDPLPKDLANYLKDLNE